MIQLGQCVNRHISTITDNYNEEAPFIFAKLDINDGYWRLQVSSIDACKFCYVLLQFHDVKNSDAIKLAALNFLQMVWCKSPPFFCAASDMARDVIDTLLLEIKFPDNPFEEKILAEEKTAQSIG